MLCRHKSASFNTTVQTCSWFPYKIYSFDTTNFFHKKSGLSPLSGHQKSLWGLRGPKSPEAFNRRQRHVRWRRSSGGRRLRTLGLRAFGKPFEERLSFQEAPTVRNAALRGRRFGHLACTPSQAIPVSLKKVAQDTFLTSASGFSPPFRFILASEGRRAGLNPLLNSIR